MLTADLESTEPRADSVHGEIRLEGADLFTSDFALRQEAAAALKVQGGRVTLEGATWTGPQTEVHLSAEGTLGPPEDPLGGADLDARLTGGADLRLLQAFAHGVESGGTASFRAKVVGKPAPLRPTARSSSTAPPFVTARRGWRSTGSAASCAGEPPDSRCRTCTEA